MIVSCPCCKKPVELSTQRWRPFCSERCHTIDFGKWADEEHRIPGAPHLPPEEERESKEH